MTSGFREISEHCGEIIKLPFMFSEQHVHCVNGDLFRMFKILYVHEVPTVLNLDTKCECANKLELENA